MGATTSTTDSVVAAAAIAAAATTEYAVRKLYFALPQETGTVEAVEAGMQVESDVVPSVALPTNTNNHGELVTSAALPTTATNPTNHGDLVLSAALPTTEINSNNHGNLDALDGAFVYGEMDAGDEVDPKKIIKSSDGNQTINNSKIIGDAALAKSIRKANVNRVKCEKDTAIIYLHLFEHRPFPLTVADEYADYMSIITSEMSSPSEYLYAAEGIICIHMILCNEAIIDPTGGIDQCLISFQESFGDESDIGSAFWSHDTNPHLREAICSSKFAELIQIVRKNRFPNTSTLLKGTNSDYCLLSLSRIVMLLSAFESIAIVPANPNLPLYETVMVDGSRFTFLLRKDLAANCVTVLDKLDDSKSRYNMNEISLDEHIDEINKYCFCPGKNKKLQPRLMCGKGRWKEIGKKLWHDCLPDAKKKLFQSTMAKISLDPWVLQSKFVGFCHFAHFGYGEGCRIAVKVKDAYYEGCTTTGENSREI